MSTALKPILHNGFKVTESLTVTQRLERVFFTEVYSLSDDSFLYVFAKLKWSEVSKRGGRYQLTEVATNGEAYPAMVVPAHSREKLAAITEDLTSARGLDSVAGMRELKTLLINDVINPLLNPEKCIWKFKAIHSERNSASMGHRDAARLSS